MEGKYHVAQVTVSDQAWVTFRRVAVARGTPVSRYLGRLVEAELEAIAGRLARETANRGGRWGDIGPALGLRPDVARSAYQRSSR